jgi:transcriptional regulator with XRE-family HTH domain
MQLNKLRVVPCLKSAQTCKIGKVFKDRRELLSLSESEVAAQLFINVNYITAIEHGDYSLSLQGYLLFSIFENMQNILI